MKSLLPLSSCNWLWCHPCVSVHLSLESFMSTHSIERILIVSRLLVIGRYLQICVHLFLPHQTEVHLITKDRNVPICIYIFDMLGARLRSKRFFVSLYNIYKCINGRVFLKSVFILVFVASGPSRTQNSNVFWMDVKSSVLQT